jgi:hypothetical protein
VDKKKSCLIKQTTKSLIFTRLSFIPLFFAGLIAAKKKINETPTVFPAEALNHTTAQTKMVLQKKIARICGFTGAN